MDGDILVQVLCSSDIQIRFGLEKKAQKVSIGSENFPNLPHVNKNLIPLHQGIVRSLFYRPYIDF